MPMLKLTMHDEEKERRFELESLRLLTTEQLFQMMFEKTRIMKELLRN